MSKIDSLTRSVVGRTEAGSAALSVRPRAIPLTTRTNANLANPLSPLAQGSTSAFKQKRRLGLVEAGPQLFEELRMHGQLGIRLGNRFGELSSKFKKFTVLCQPRKPQITSAFLSASQDGSFTPQIEIDLSEVETIGGGFECLESVGPIG
jgi:hypothetical protein